MLKHGKGSPNNWLWCRVGVISLEITYFNGKSVAVLSFLSLKSCSFFPESQSDLSERTTSEIIIYAENSMPSPTYFFIGPALDNACWAGPLRGSLQRKGQFLVSSIIYDKNAGKNRQKEWFKNVLNMRVMNRVKFEQYLACVKMKWITCTESWILHSSL